MQVRSISLSAPRAPPDPRRGCACRSRAAPSMRASERSDNSAGAALRLASASGAACDVGGGDAGSAFSRTASGVERVSASAFGRCAATAGASLAQLRCVRGDAGRLNRARLALQPWTARCASPPHPDPERTRPAHSVRAARSVPASPRRADGPTTSRRPASRPSRRRSRTRRQVGRATTMRQPGHSRCDRASSLERAGGARADTRVATGCGFAILHRPLPWPSAHGAGSHRRAHPAARATASGAWRSAERR